MRATLGGIWGIMVICVIFSCTKSDITTDLNERNPAGGQKPDIDYNVNAALMLDMVNDVRAKGCNCGNTAMPAVAALTWNDMLAKAAFDHSDDMKVNNYFSHTSGGNKTAGDRMRLAGYDWRAYGENIASGQTTEQVVMNSWLNSEGHCKNLMNKNFKEMGVGRSGNYWTQVFGAK